MGKVAKAVQLAKTRSFRRAMLAHRVGAAIEHQAMLQGRRFATVIDVGANRGQFSLLARELNPDATIFAFEPVPACARRYQAIFRRDSRVRFRQVAVSDTAGVTAMYVGSASDNSSLLDLEQRHGEVIEVAAARLDDILPEEVSRPALLKVDAEGWDAHVLAGAPRTLTRVDMVVVEMSFDLHGVAEPTADEIASRMRDAGFQLTGVAAPYWTDGRVAKIDGIFARPGY